MRNLSGGNTTATEELLAGDVSGTGPSSRNNLWQRFQKTLKVNVRHNSGGSAGNPAVENQA